jgi:hypothetical protein
LDVSSGGYASSRQKIERLRVGGGSASSTQMAMWLAKEGGFHEIRRRESKP